MNLSAEDKAVIRSLTEELIAADSTPGQLAAARQAWGESLRLPPAKVRATSAYIEYEATKATAAAGLSTPLPTSGVARLARAVRALPDEAQRESAVTDYAASVGLPPGVVRGVVDYYNRRLLGKEGGVAPIDEALRSPLARAAGLTPPEPAPAARGHEVDYSLCPNKRRHRGLELQFIRTHSGPAELNDGYTVYLPSRQAELQGEGLIRLGIRPDRIVGVENEPAIRDEFERSCRALGIQSRFGDVQGFLAACAERGVKLRHVLLDFDSQFCRALYESLQELDCSNAFVLSVNVQGRREPALWRDQMRLLATIRSEQAPEDPRSYADVDSLSSREWFRSFQQREPQEKYVEAVAARGLQSFEERGGTTGEAREAGFIHGLRRMLPVLVHPEVSEAIDLDRHDKYVHYGLYLANLAYERLQPVVGHVAEWAWRHNGTGFPERLLYEACKFAFLSERFLSACESWSYRSSSGAGTTPMFSVFAKVAPAFFLDYVSPSVAQFIRATGFAAARDREVPVGVGDKRLFWGSWWMRDTKGVELMPGAKEQTVRVKLAGATVGKAPLVDFYRAFRGLTDARAGWLHDDQLARVRTRDVHTAEPIDD